MGERKAVWRKM